MASRSFGQNGEAVLSLLLLTSTRGGKGEGLDNNGIDQLEIPSTILDREGKRRGVGEGTTSA